MTCWSLTPLAGAQGVDEDAIATLSAHLAANDDLVGGSVDPRVLEHQVYGPVDPGEDSGNGQQIGARTDQVGARPPAGEQSHRVNDDRFPGSRRTADDVQALAELDRRVLYDCQIADLEISEHVVMRQGAEAARASLAEA